MERISRAFYLIDDNEHPFSGYEFDNRGLAMDAKGMNAKFNFEKVNPEYETLLKRKFRLQTSGVVTLEANFSINCTDGFSLKLYDEYRTTALGVVTEKGEFVLTDRTHTGIFPKASTAPDDGKNSFKAVIDLDRGVYRAVVNNTDFGMHTLPDGVKTLHFISIGIEKGYTGTLFARGIKLYANYACNERFLAPFGGVTPYDWTVNCDNAEAGTVYSQYNTFTNEDRYYYGMTCRDGGSVVLNKKVEKLVGDRCFEIKFIESDGVLDTSFVLGAEKDVVIVADGGALLLKDGDTVTEICKYPHNLWNTLRLEIGDGEITVRLNGKDKGVFSADISDYTDEITVIANAKKGANTAGIDDILLFGLDPLPADYVPKPVPAKTKGYNVGLHVCSLWRYGFWRGTHDATWDVCSAFDEVTPLLGYYDEGIPEVADWENKWFCENGIDFQLQCWYGPTTIAEPIKFPGFSYALHDGYFNSQYKSYSKFAIMWENCFTNHITPEAFKEYLVPYFIEYYFKDPGYYKIDNKPVFSIYSIGRLWGEDYFGSIENAKACLDYMREECKKAGFDGMILWSASGAAGEDSIQRLESVGVEGCYAYNWGTPSYTSTYQETRLQSAGESAHNYGKHGLVHVPTVGVGFNAVARHDKRTPSISLDEYEKILTWTRDEYLGNREFFPDENSWQSKTVLLSCWNEFDEGHYINPSGLHGFGFLDKLRKVFTEEAPHGNQAPTESQKKRVNILYPEGHAWLRPERRLPPIKPPKNAAVTASWDFSNNEDFDRWNLCADAADKEMRDGCLCGRTTGEDPQVVYDRDVNVPTDKVNWIHVEMKTTDKHGKLIKDSGCCFYYTTTTAGWQLLGGRAAYNEETGYTDVYFSALGANGWAGDLLTLRFDPYEMFAIRKIEMLYSDETVLGFNIDGAFVMTEIPLEPVGDDKYVAFYSKCMLMNKLSLSYHWNRAEKKFSLLYKDKEYKFENGSDICVCGEEEIKLPCPMKLIDGVPALPIKALCDIFGYTCNFNGNDVSITTK